MRGQLVHHIVGDVLPGAPGHIVDDGGALIEHRLEVPHQACARAQRYLKVLQVVGRAVSCMQVLCMQMASTLLSPGHEQAA